MSNTENTQATTPVATIPLSTPGVYVSAEGLEKAAVVVNTVESTKEGGKIESPNPGYVHLLVFTLGGVSTRINIPLEETAALIPDHTVDGELVGYFRTSQSAL
jgi:hypothetical protein